MTPIQVLLSAVALIAILRVTRETWAGRMTPLRAALWVGLWAVGLLATWFPAATSRVACWIGVGRGADAVLYVAIAVLGYLVFRLYLALERQEQAVTRITELALRDLPTGFADDPPARVDAADRAGAPLATPPERTAGGGPER